MIEPGFPYYSAPFYLPLSFLLEQSICSYDGPEQFNCTAHFCTRVSRSTAVFYFVHFFPSLITLLFPSAHKKVRGVGWRVGYSPRHLRVLARGLENWRPRPHSCSFYRHRLAFLLLANAARPFLPTADVRVEMRSVDLRRQMLTGMT